MTEILQLLEKVARKSRIKTDQPMPRECTRLSDRVASSIFEAKHGPSLEQSVVDFYRSEKLAMTYRCTERSGTSWEPFAASR